MKITRSVYVSKFAFDVLEMKKKDLNSKDKISYGMLCDVAILKLFCPEKLLLLKQVKEYRELIDVFEK